jgi:hypothetical protein
MADVNLEQSGLLQGSGEYALYQQFDIAQTTTRHHQYFSLHSALVVA